MGFSDRHRQEILEAMESCRSGSDDLGAPELAELAAHLADDAELRERWRRIERADEAIRAAFGNVHVPAELTEKVSRRLAEVAGPDHPPATTPDRPIPRHRDSLSPRSQRFSRRRLVVGLVALSAAAALLTAVWLESHRPAAQLRRGMLEEAMDFFNRDLEPLGKLVSHEPPPADYPISRDLNPEFFRQNGVRWRWVEGFLGSRAVAYDLPLGGSRATLYVVNCKTPGLPSLPPGVPAFGTGGKSAGAWQTETTLYVLVVEGDAETYSLCLANRQIV